LRPIAKITAFEDEIHGTPSFKLAAYLRLKIWGERRKNADANSFGMSLAGPNRPAFQVLQCFVGRVAA
jgi:hypothetical protein